MPAGRSPEAAPKNEKEPASRTHQLTVFPSPSSSSCSRARPSSSSPSSATSASRAGAQLASTPSSLLPSSSPSFCSVCNPPPALRSARLWHVLHRSSTRSDLCRLPAASQDMEKETELQVSRKSAENGGAQLKPLQPLPLGKVLFRLPQPEVDEEDDDGNDCISLKEWQPVESTNASSVEPSETSYSAWQPVKEKGTSAKGSVRSRTGTVGYTPLVQSNGDVCLPSSVHGDQAKLPTEEIEGGQDQEEEDDHVNGTYEARHEEDDLEDDEPEVESAVNHIAEPEEETHNPRPKLKVSHHQHNISLVNGIAPPPTHPTGGIAFDISLDDHESSSQSRRSTGSSRGSSLRVSFINDVMLDSPSPPRHSSKNNTKSPLRSRPGHHSKSPTNSKPSWESSTKIGKPSPPMPKKFVRPTLHGIKVKKGQGGVAKTALRASTSSLETSENKIEKNGFQARAGLPKEPAVGRSWDPQSYCGGGDYDSVSQLISKSLIVSSTDDNKTINQSKEDSSIAGRPAVTVPRSSNGVRKHGDRVLQNGGEVLKSGATESNNKLTGDFGKLLSKLRRAAAPLSKPPPSKQQQPAAAVHPKPPSTTPLLSKIARANSTPVHSETPKATTKKTLAPVHSLDSSGANQKYAIGSYASLKLLQECAQTEKVALTPAHNVHKPRKIRDHEPHRHYYKTITKTLDNKLKA